MVATCADHLSAHAGVQAGESFASNARTGGKTSRATCRLRAARDHRRHPTSRAWAFGIPWRNRQLLASLPRLGALAQSVVPNAGPASKEMDRPVRQGAV